MMRYVYRCTSRLRCGEFEVDKPMKDAARMERCPNCGSLGIRQFKDIGVDVKNGTPKHH